MAEPQPPQNQTPPSEKAPLPASGAPRTASEIAIQAAKDLGHVSVLAAISATLPALGGILLLTMMPGIKARIEPAIEQLGLTAAVLYALLFAVASGFAILPTYAMSIAAGYFFGLPVGGPAAVIGVGVGAVIGYAWSSLLARKKAMQVIDSDKRARAVRDALADRGHIGTVGVVALLRFPPNSPFAITNLVMGATSVRFIPFAIGTVIGMAPRTILAAWIGSTAGDLVDAVKSGAGPWKLIGIGVSVAVALAVFWLFGRWSKQALARLQEAEGVTPP